MSKNDSFFKLVGDNIRHYRKKRGFSQEKLAVHADTNDRYISSIERGKKNVTLETLIRIGKALDVEPHLLLVPHKRKES
jgi:transcriptional regulator with XRE-family HTH domain